MGVGQKFGLPTNCVMPISQAIAFRGISNDVTIGALSVHAFKEKSIVRNLVLHQIEPARARWDLLHGKPLTLDKAFQALPYHAHEVPRQGMISSQDILYSNRGRRRNIDTFIQEIGQFVRLCKREKAEIGGFCCRIRQSGNIEIEFTR